MGDRQKPEGASEMLDPGAWPDSSESQFYRVAQDCLDALRRLTNNGARPWESHHRDTFRSGGGFWSGGTAGAADSKGSRILTQFTDMQNYLTTAANWNNDMSHVVAGAKDSIITNVNNAKSDIAKISTDDPDYDTLVHNRKIQCYNANLAVVSNAAAAVASPQNYRPPASEQELLTNGLPPAPMSATPPPAGSPSATPPPAGSPSTPPPPTKGSDPTQAEQHQQTPLPPNAPTGNNPSPSPAGPNKSTGPTQSEQHQQQTPPPANTPTGNDTPSPSSPTKTVDPVQAQQQVQQHAPAAQAVADPNIPGNVPGAAVPSPPSAARTTGGGGTSTAATSGGSPNSGSGLGTGGGSGTQQSGNPTGQPTGAQPPGGQPNNPLQQGLQQLNQGLQSGAGNASQPLAAAQPATQQPTTPPPATPTGAASGTSAASAAPVGAASAAGGGSVGGPAAAAPTAPAAPLGPAPTPSPAAPVAQPGQGGPVGPAGPGVAAAGTNNQQAAAAAAPIPVSPARAERDAMAAAAKAGLLQRKSAGNTDADIEIARRISAALHAPPSIPAASYQFVWAVGVTSEGQILAANSYGIGYIPDGVKLPGQVTLVSADEAISPAERGRWVNFPFLAIQGWAQFHGKTLRAIIGTPEEVKPYKSSMHAEELAPDDIPADGTMQGRSRLQVIAPEAAARLEEWADVTLYEALPPRPVQDAPPDAKQTMKLWVETIKPLLRTTGTNGPVDHLTKLIAYADHMQSVELYKAYTAPHVAAQRAAMSDWIYWQHVSSICQDATNPVLGSVQA
ncbi:hypothetical protein MPHO_31790 [Mycolicibacterium phocaicum]|nr:hypothetical protein MPHO_31790 [Mycolicibacterium phocaicum]